ncbi:1,4-alpha-glucan branching enzyme [Kineothrix alysoides]|uniref:1,4-alpha-glucan branching enzyme GlgB n=1 Tax=Kineothrix alysoides TaxID=1469948 RepID=A0A4R1R385_9FIRM|nr:1,4-alpha-glucan branching protein GlgB [Kineothrix alysoides]TCL59849.1 1,4-alpha-glucan branching enzyme [Kineothrix alysoides]
MNNKLYKLMNWPKIEAIIYSESDNPHEILGAHAAGNHTLVQAFFPGAKSVLIQDKKDKKSYEMELADGEGFFAALIPGKIPMQYEYIVEDEEGKLKKVKDAYNFAPQIEKKDMDKFAAGIHYTVYEKLGAHPKRLDGVNGVYFAVWAPGAVRVSAVGDFNDWDGRVHQMRRLGDSGIFEIFVPDAKEGQNYKYELKIKGGLTYLKADPYAFGQQLRPDTASVIRGGMSSEKGRFKWEDAQWLAQRKERQGQDKPISIYELYLGSFRAGEDGSYLNYKELAPLIIEYVTQMGYTHIELMPVMEHPFDGSWGYQVIGYYAPTSRYGTNEDFMYFMNEMHKAGIGVILDWVPAHFPRDVQGLSNFDGTCLYEHQDPRRGYHPHWGTLIYNYGRPQVSNYLIANALFWIERYHADGIRMDAVASMLYLDYGKSDGQWLPNIYGGHENLEAIEFLKHLNSIVKKRDDGVLMIAEESTAWPNVTGEVEDNGLGFDIKWNMGWMNDYLGYITYDPYFRVHHHNELTFSMVYAYSEKFMLVFSHDEVVHGKATMIGKMPGELKEKFANLRLTYAYMMVHPGKKLLFMGQDIAEFDEWNEKREVEWGLLQYDSHKGIQNLVKTLNDLYKNYPAFYKCDASWDGFEWINCISSNDCMLVFMRKSDVPEDTLVVMANFANVQREYTIGVSLEGKYKEILNTDDAAFGGEGVVNGELICSEQEEFDGRPYSIQVISAPLSVSVFSYTPYTLEEEKEAARRKEERIRKEKEEALERERQEKIAALEKERQEKQAEAEKALEEAKEAKERAERMLKAAEEVRLEEERVRSGNKGRIVLTEKKPGKKK